MELSNLEIMEKIDEARKFQKLGKFKEAEKVYSDSLINNGNSFDLIYSYALFLIFPNIYFPKVLTLWFFEAIYLIKGISIISKDATL